jgi:hypothetical protein
VDLVPDPLLLGKYGSAGNRIRTSGTLTTRPQRQFRSYLKEKIAALILKAENIAVGICHPLSAKVGTNFADMRCSSGRYSSLTD